MIQGLPSGLSSGSAWRTPGRAPRPGASIVELWDSWKIPGSTVAPPRNVGAAREGCCALVYDAMLHVFSKL